MQTDRFDFVRAALADYGATIGENNQICKGDLKFSAVVSIERMHLVISTLEGRKLFTGAPAAHAVRHFVESYWYWEKVKK